MPGDFPPHPRYLGDSLPQTPRIRGLGCDTRLSATVLFLIENTPVWREFEASNCFCMSEHETSFVCSDMQNPSILEKGRKSSIPSPAPMKRIGKPSCWAIARAMPPFAIPSSFVNTTPLSFAASENTSACRKPFCPKVESHLN